MIDSPLRALTPKGGILWCSNSGRSNKNLMSEICWQKKKRALFSIPKSSVSWKNSITLIYSFVEFLALFRALHLRRKAKALARMRDCGAPIAPARHSKMHVELSKNTATRKTKNGIEGIVSIKRIEDQPTSGGLWWSLAEEEPYSIGALARYN